MMYGHYLRGTDEEAVFDLFFRRERPATLPYALVAGLQQAIEITSTTCAFEEEDIRYLDSLHLFNQGFLDTLRHALPATCQPFPRGTPVFPGEPLLRQGAHHAGTAGGDSPVDAHQSPDADRNQGQPRGAMRRERRKRAGVWPAPSAGPDAGIYGARAAIIGGCVGTSNVLTGQLYDVPVSGTHGHSWVMSFDSELEAFRAYAEAYPDACLLLVDSL